MSDVLMRLVMTLALVPFGLAIGLAFEEISFSWWRSEVFWGMASVTLFVIVAFRVLWHAYLRGRGIREAKSIPVTAAVVGHLLLWQPIFNVGCMEELLLVSQGIAMLGLWAVVWSYACWGLTGWLSRSAVRPSPTEVGERLMPDRAVRVIVSFGLLPLTVGLASILLVTGLPEWAVIPTMAVLFTCAWLLVWRSVIPSGARVWALTLTLSAIGIAAAVLAAVVKEPYGAAVLSTAWGLFIAGTAWVWRDRSPPLLLAGAVEQRLRCPQCDYCLIGRSEVRCPECGWAGQLEELFALMLDPGL